MKKVLTIIILVILSFVISSCGYVSLSSVKDHHFDIITANSIFCGFLFSTLALLVSLFNEDMIINYERTNRLEAVYETIFNGIFYGIFSIFISVLNSFVVFELPFSNYLIATFLKAGLTLEILLFLTSASYFLVSVRALSILIRKMRERIRAKYITENDAASILIDDNDYDD